MATNGVTATAPWTQLGSQASSDKVLGVSPYLGSPELPAALLAQKVAVSKSPWLQPVLGDLQRSGSNLRSLLPTTGFSPESVA